MIASYFDPTSQSKICAFGEVEVLVVFDLNPTIFAFKSQCTIEFTFFNPFDFTTDFTVVPVAGDILNQIAFFVEEPSRNRAVSS